MVGSPGASNQSRLRSLRCLPSAPFLSAILVPPICLAGAYSRSAPCARPSFAHPVIPSAASELYGPGRSLATLGMTAALLSFRCSLHRNLFLEARDVAVDRRRGQRAAAELVAHQAVPAGDVAVDHKL